MRLSKTRVTLFALLASLASCSTVHLNPAERAALDPLSPRWEVGIFHEESEIDSIKFDDPGHIQETRKDVTRRRSGARVSYGIEYVQGYAELFGGESLGSSEDYGGMGMGAMAEITLHDFDNGLSLFFPYKLGVNFAGGEGDFGSEHIDFATFEAVSDIGIGLDIKGFRPSIGISSRSLRGLLEFEGEDELDDDHHHHYDEDDFEDAEADFTSAYFELAYRPSDSPLQLSVRALSGDETGFYFGATILF